MNHLVVLPYKYEECLLQAKDEMFEKYHVIDVMSDRLIRDKVLQLLDRFCTVVYFPLCEERNNGFHITEIPFINGDSQHFVFINTAQTIEKQVFTAAHELGHIWKVDEYVCQKLDLVATSDLREQIISRFAAILLMPPKAFKEEVLEILCRINSQNNNIGFMSFIKLVVMLMNRFFVPHKSIILRMVELEMLSIESAERVLCCDDEMQRRIELILKQTISELGYVEFQNPTNKKWIEGLSSVLDFAEKEHAVSQTKIDNMRRNFDLNKHISIEGKDVFTLNTNKDFKNDAT